MEGRSGGGGERDRVCVCEFFLEVFEEREGKRERGNETRSFHEERREREREVRSSFVRA